MVKKYKSPIRIYKHPFELVMAAYVRRFPICDLIPVLVATDVLSEETSEDGSREVIERRCKLNVDAPYLLKKMAGVDFFYCIQRNTLDRRARTLKIEAWNETFAKKIIINEFCTYFVHEENPEWTCFEQSASLEVKSFFGLENAIEKLAVKHYAASIDKGKEIIDLYIDQLREEGITSVPQFKVQSHDDEEPKKVSNCISIEEPEACQDRKESLEVGATCGSPGLDERVVSQPESRRESLEHQSDQPDKNESPQTNHSLHSGLHRDNSVKNQVMSKAKNKISFIYNVINENIQREAV